MEYEPVFRLGNTFKEKPAHDERSRTAHRPVPGSGLRFLRRSHLPDSGGRHCPGDATPNDCIYVLRSNIADLSQKIRHLTRERESGDSMPEEDKVLLRKYISELTTDLASFGVPERQKRKD